MTTLEIIKDWGKPAGVALVVGVLITAIGWKTSIEAMGAQVTQNASAITALASGLTALAKDKISELEGKLAVLWRRRPAASCRKRPGFEPATSSRCWCCCTSIPSVPFGSTFFWCASREAS